MSGKITIDNEFCKGCGFCVEFCPKDTINMTQKMNLKGYTFAEFIENGCTGCAICATVCPEAAIEVYRG